MSEPVRIGDTILVPSVDSGRYCLRCGASIYTTDGPHLCRDVAQRQRDAYDLAWREYARELVVLGGEA